MSASKRIAIAVTISWVSRAVSILSGLLLMPILFRFMGKEELGLWFLLGNFQTESAYTITKNLQY
jgi:O-antigen/teichoic acid export membrane protein